MLAEVRVRLKERLIAVQLIPEENCRDSTTDPSGHWVGRKHQNINLQEGDHAMSIPKKSGRRTVGGGQLFTVQVTRKEFLKLPMTVRRRALMERAKAIAPYYEEINK